MHSPFGTNIILEKDTETHQWVVIARTIRSTVEGKQTESLLELGRGYSSEEAYCNAIKDLVSAVRNGICAAERGVADMNYYLKKYEDTERRVIE